ncbi:hypothetical protein [Xanthomonas campestris]|uniref:hypothetical protein n=1 Tax=Xanthomonas TaxID=338 RepID=UPI001E3B380B|nr:hypothetical protein [Xanthomonas campestris]MCC5044475.1 hypothetical protein [Xanthomonas campestris]
MENLFNTPVTAVEVWGRAYLVSLHSYSSKKARKKADKALKIYLKRTTSLNSAENKVSYENPQYRPSFGSLWDFVEFKSEVPEGVGAEQHEAFVRAANASQARCRQARL